MNKEDVLKIIQELNEKQTETVTIETKSAKNGKPSKYYDTISSFSNTFGGIILFGIDEVKHKNKTIFEISGLYDANDLQKSITNLCSTEFQPVIRPKINVISIEDKKVVVVKIDALQPRNKPCYYKPKGLHAGAFIRVGDRDDQMTEYEIYKCISYRDNEQEDRRPVLDATIDDFDKELLEKFIFKAKEGKEKFSKFSDEEILLTMGVLTKVENKIFPTVAGIMVLGLYPQKFFPQWFVAAMVFPGFKVAELGESGQRFNNNKRIDGNIVEMYNETIAFLNRSIKVKIRLNKITGLREDIPEYPMDALREAVSNMLIHRDMSKYKESTYISISVFKNRIEFRNAGNLYGSNTIESITSERDVEVRNRTTIQILEILGEAIENRHTGVQTMITEMRKANLPRPVLENQREDFVVTFYNGEYPELYPEELIDNKKTQDKKTQDKKTQDKKTQDRKLEKINKILEICKEPKSLNEIMIELGYKSNRTLKRDYINILIKENKLKMTLPDKPTSKYQKYITII